MLIAINVGFFLCVFFFYEEGDTQSFYADFSICPKPHAAPAARPWQAPKDNRLLPRQELNSDFSQISVHASGA